MSIKMHYYTSSAITLALAICLAGCGTGDPFDYVPVSGKITYEDGSIIPAGRIVLTFIPQTGTLDPATHPRPGIAEVNVADGTFDMATSRAYGDGIIKGKHKVVVRTLAGPSDAIPTAYTAVETTPLEVAAADSPFDLRIRRP